MEKITKDNFTSPEGDFETRIGFALAFSVTIIVVVIRNEEVKKNIWI